MIAQRRRLRMRLRLVAAGVAVVALVVTGWLWLRDSSLVAVRKVEISGLSGPDAAQIRSALTASARNMTTLDVRLGQLRTVVAPYPVVKNLRVATEFPHGMRIQVVEQLPVGALVAGGRAVAATADGMLLRDVGAGSLPTIPVGALPGGSRVTEGQALQALALLAATPRRLLARIAEVSSQAPHGPTVQLRSGPSIYFGDLSDLDAKWIAATEVLADPGSAGATYIDVTDPAHPAAGVGAAVVGAAGLATNGSQSTVPGATGSPLGAQPPTSTAPSPGSGTSTPVQASTSGG